MVVPGDPESNARGNLGRVNLARGEVKEGKPIGIGNGAAGVYGKTTGDVGTETGDAQVGRRPRCGGGVRSNRLGLGWLRVRGGVVWRLEKQR